MIEILSSFQTDTLKSFEDCRKRNLAQSKHSSTYAALPSLSSPLALTCMAQNLVSKYSESHLLLESDLHTRVLQKKITPNLPSFVPAMKAELDYAASRVIPECKGMSSKSKPPVH